MNILITLQQKYNLNSDSYSSQELVNIPEWMYEKWSPFYGEGWYGIDCGLIPSSWVNVIDEFLDWVKDNNPNFYIQQIKVKFGEIRIYVGNCDFYTDEFCVELGQLLYDTRLVY